MKKQFFALIGFLLAIGMMTGCSDAADSNLSAENSRDSSSLSGGQSGEEDDDIPSSNATELTVQFGDSGDSFVMHLEDNSTAAALRDMWALRIGGCRYTATMNPTSWSITIFPADMRFLITVKP